MPVSNSQKKATYNYKKRNYDFFQILLPLGKKAELMEHAKKREESLNQFINRAIETQLQADQAEEIDFSGLD